MKISPAQVAFVEAAPENQKMNQNRGHLQDSTAAGTSERPSPLNGTAAEEHPEIRRVAKEFESLFVNQMVSAMRKTVTRGGLIPESNAERVYQSMLDSQYAEKISDTQQLGLSQMIYQHLLRKASAR